MMRSKITRILSYKHQKHQKNYSTFRQFSNYTHYSALFRGAKLRNSGTPKGQVTVLIYDNTLLLFRIRTCPLSPSSGVLPLTLLNLGCTRHSSSELGSALICTRFQAAECLRRTDDSSVKSVVERINRLLAVLWIYCVKHPLADIRYKIRYKDEGLTVG